MTRFCCIAALLLVTAGPLRGQTPAVSVSVYGSVGWLHSTNGLTSQSGGTRAAAEDGPVAGVGLGIRLPRPLPALRLSVQRLLSSDLVLEERVGDLFDNDWGSAGSFGSIGYTTVLLEALIAPVQIGPVEPHVSLGAGYIYYDLPEVADPDISRWLKEENVSPTMTVGAGASMYAGRFTVMLEARDLISTFDTNPMEDEQRPGSFVSDDRFQNDFVFTLSFGYRVGQW